MDRAILRYALAVLLLLPLGLAYGQGGFDESFRDPGLPGWERHCSPGDELTVRDGRLHLRARTHTYAHLSRAVPADSFRVSTTVRHLSGVQGLSWCPSLMLYWDEDNWAKIGLDMNSAVHVLVVVGGMYNETVDFKAPQDAEVGLSLELLEDGVRFGARIGEGEWQPYTLRDRPKSWRGALRLIVGKAFTLRSQDFPKPDGDNDYTDPGDWCDAEMGPVSLREFPAGQRKLTPDEKERLKAGLADADGERILATPGEPSFERVAALYPPIQHGRVSTGVPEHPDEIIVHADGRIELGDYSVRLRLGDELVGSELSRVTRSLGAGWIPIHSLTYTVGDLTCTLRVFGMSEGGRPDTPTVGYVQATVSNKGAQAARVPLRLIADAPGAASVAETFEIPSGQSRAMDATLAYTGGALHSIPETEYSAELRACEAMWRKWLAPAAEIAVPEARVCDGYKAWLAYNFLNVDTVDGKPCPHDGCKFYEQVYGQTVAVYIEALDQYGYHREAKRYLDTLLSWQRADGQLVCSYECWFEHGMVLDALCKHYLYTRDRAWLRRVAPKLIAAARFIVGEREKTQRLGTDPAPPLVRGLLPPSRPYCDYGQPVVSLVTDGWCCVALERTAGVLRELGERGEADYLAADARAYRARISQVASEAIVESQGMPALKLEPLTGRILNQSGGLAKDYYSMYGCGIQESRFFGLHDPTLDVLVNFLQRAGGLSLGVTSFAGGIDHAYTSGYWLTMLDRGEVKRVLLAFYAMLAYGMTQDTYSGVEVTMHRTGDNQATLPHLASGAHQLRLLRCMIAEEVGDELRLLPAIPRAWLASPEGVSIKGIATFSGDVALTARRDPGRGDTIVAQMDLTTRAAGKRIVLRLPHPDSHRLVAATVNGKPSEVKGDCVVFPWCDHARAMAKYAR